MRLKIIIPILMVLIFIATGCALQSKKGVPMCDIAVKTPAFHDRGAIPIKYANYGIPGGNNISLPLFWSNVPGAKSYAILMYDTNPVAHNFIHWAVINIPSKASGIPEGASGTSARPKGCKELTNSFGTKGYGGPQPPVGTGKHIYVIKVFALDTDAITFSGAVNYQAFMSAVSGKVIGQGEITGWFGQ